VKMFSFLFGESNFNEVGLDRGMSKKFRDLFSAA